MNMNSSTLLTDLFEVAKDTLQDLQPNEEFIVKELFRGFEWNRIPKGIRTKLGSLFYSYAEGQGSTIIKALDKTPQNQQRYKKL